MCREQPEGVQSERCCSLAYLLESHSTNIHKLIIISVSSSSFNRNRDNAWLFSEFVQLIAKTTHRIGWAWWPLYTYLRTGAATLKCFYTGYIFFYIKLHSSIYRFLGFWVRQKSKNLLSRLLIELNAFIHWSAIGGESFVFYHQIDKVSNCVSAAGV